jgi:hypothetical protein
VLASVPEMCRVLRPGRRLSVLITEEMQPDVTRAALLTDLQLLARYPIRRQKMQAMLLVYRRRP